MHVVVALSKAVPMGHARQYAAPSSGACLPAAHVVQPTFGPTSDAKVLVGHLWHDVRPLVALVAALGFCVPAGQLVQAQSICVFLRYVPAGHVAPCLSRLPGHVEQTGAPWPEKKP